MSDYRVSVTMDVSNLGDLEKLRKLLGEVGDASDKAGGKLDGVAKASKAAASGGGLAAAFAKAKAASQEYSNSLHGLSQKINDFKDRHQNAFANLQKASLAGAAGLATMGVALKGATQKAMEYESAFAQVRKVVDFENPDGLKNMRAELEKLSEQIPVTVTDLADIAAAGGQLGVAEKDLLGFTQMVANMATAFDMSADAAGDAMAKLANVWSKPITEMQEFGDMINAVSNNTPAKAAQIVEALGRIGGTAKSFGLSEKAAVSLSSAMIGLGKAPEVAATALNSMLTTLSTLDAKNKGVAKAFADMGLSAESFAKTVKEKPNEAIETLLKSLNAMPKELQIEAASSIFGKNFGDDILALASAPDLLAKINDVLKDSQGYAGSMVAEAQNVADTAAAKMQTLQNAFDNAKAAIGDAFLPALVQVMQAVQPVVAQFSQWAAANPELVAKIAAISAAILGVVTALGALGLAFSAVSMGFSALAVLASPIGLVAAAIAGLVTAGVLLYQNWDAISQKIPILGAAVEFLRDGFAFCFEYVEKRATAFAQAFAQALETTIAYWASKIESVKRGFEILKTALGDASAFFVGLGASLAGALSGAVDKASQTLAQFGAAWEGVKNKAAEALSGIGQSLASFVAAATSAFGGFVALAQEKMQQAKTAIASAWSAILGATTHVLGAIRQAVAAQLNAVLAAITGALERIKNAFASAFALIKALVRGDTQGVVEALRTGMQNGVNVSKSTSTSIVAAFRGLGSNLLQAGRDAIQGLINGMGQRLALVRSKAAEIASAAAQAVRGTLIIRSPSRLMHQYGDFVATGFALGIADNAQKAAKSAKDMAKQVKDNVKNEVANLKRQIALFGNDDPLVALGYDVAAGKYGNENVSELVALTGELKALKANKAVLDDIAKIGFEMKTHGKSRLELLEYEIAHTDKYKDVLAQNLDKYRAILKENEAFSEELKKQQALQASNNALLSRQADLQKRIDLFGDKTPFASELYDLQRTDADAAIKAKTAQMYQTLAMLQTQQQSKDAFVGMLGGMQQDSPLGKIQAEYAERLRIAQEYENAHTNVTQEANAARMQIEQSYAQAKSSLLLSQGQNLFNGLSGMAKAFAGEQSKAYRVLFGIEKGFAIAQAAIAIQQSVAKAMAVGFPANIPLIASAVSQGASILSTIKSIQAPVGQAHDGIMSVPQSGTWNLQKGERVLPKYTAQALDNTLENLSAGQGAVNVVIHNHTAAKVSAEPDGDGRIRVLITDEINKQVPNQLANPSSPISKGLQNNWNVTPKR